LEELLWRQNFEPERAGQPEIPNVVRDNGICLSLNGQLQYEIVVRISQQRPPKEEDLAVFAKNILSCTSN